MRNLPGKKSQVWRILAVGLAVWLGLGYVALSLSADADPLPSWNDAPAKEAILKFVAAVTSDGTPTFLPPAERLAVFDNDGTLWVEQPMYTQFIFAMDRVAALAPQHPKWKSEEPFKTILSRDPEQMAKIGRAHV